MVRKQNYISEITKTNSGGDASYYDVSTETEEIETGFTMDVLPRILEHGRLMLMFNLTLSDLISLEKSTWTMAAVQAAERAGSIFKTRLSNLAALRRKLL